MLNHTNGRNILRCISKRLASKNIFNRDCYYSLDSIRYKVHIKQIYNNNTKDYIIIKDNDNITRFQDVQSHSSNSNDKVNSKNSNSNNYKQKAKLFVNDITSYFLPKGYPTSVRSGYIQFTQGQMLSMVLSTTGGVLSMQSLLYAIGLGAGSIPLAATLNWIIKDGLGQLGGVIFASFVSNNFDSDPKRWRILATVSMELSSLLELLTPLVPQYFLPIASVANIGKNISWLSASASRAAIHKSFAIHENLADITAKTGSQNIVSSLIGTSIGVSIAAALGGDFTSTLITYCIISSTSIGITYYSLTNVTITLLSLQRLEYLLHYYVINLYNKNCNKWLSPTENLQHEQWLGVPSMPTLPADLRFILANSTSNSSNNNGKEFPAILIGCDVSEVFTAVQQYEQVKRLFNSNKYIINAVSNNTGSNNNSNNNSNSGSSKVYLLFNEDAELSDVVQGLIHSYLIRLILYNECNKINSNKNSNDDNIFQRLDVLEMAYSIINNSEGVYDVKGMSEELINNTEWKLSIGMLEPKYARIRNSSNNS